MIKRSPLFFFLIIAIALLLEPLLPPAAAAFFLTVSMVVKSLIMSYLPFLVLALLALTCSQLSAGATRTIFSILLLICLSNFLMTALGCLLGRLAYWLPLEFPRLLPIETLRPLFDVTLPIPLPCGLALFLGAILGTCGLRDNFSHTARCQRLLERFIQISLRWLLRLLPFFIFGFMIKLRADGLGLLIFQKYLAVFVLIIACQFTLLLGLLFVLCRFSAKRFRRYLKNFVPPMICAFSTMSSAATLPLTLEAVQKNSHNKLLARTVIPLSVNIHLLANNLAVPILAFALLKSYHLPLPGWSLLLSFLVFSVITKFSAIAVPGGGIVVLLPLLEKYFSFSPEMSSTIFSIYLLFNPILTVVNVLGNGILAKLIERILTIRAFYRRRKRPAH